MEWAMSLLLNHPEVLEKSRAEINSHIENGCLIDDLDLANLPYLHYILNETLRLFPTVPLLAAHSSAEECTIGGYKIPRGTMLMVNAYAIHRDPKLWEEPNSFKPKRFEGIQGEGVGFKYPSWRCQFSNKIGRATFIEAYKLNKELYIDKLENW
ncbi:hypothetical protein IFM89_014071 [Coptis chinensis]|uniref:Cytochrome P450 n=1 Tax=Coptis chinensis TaxID=261450 RepID=A0A835HK37_9MAGN|nr:hypothetical protein IFM89_014071 [Coptis chinensis]